MPSVTPVTCTDLNGVQLEANAIMSDELIDIIGYTTNLCADLGTPNDTPEGYEDYKSFIKEIKEAQIQTFEPEALTESMSFSELDLTGENIEIFTIPPTYYAMQNGQYFYGNVPIGYMGATPFDIKKNEEYVMSGYGVTPFDIGVSRQRDEVVLTS